MKFPHEYSTYFTKHLHCAKNNQNICLKNEHLQFEQMQCYTHTKKNVTNMSGFCYILLYIILEWSYLGLFVIFKTENIAADQVYLYSTFRRSNLKNLQVWPSRHSAHGQFGFPLQKFCKFCNYLLSASKKKYQKHFFIVQLTKRTTLLLTWSKEK